MEYATPDRRHRAMKKYLTVVASFVIMLCIGGIYSWSIIASALMEDYQLSAIQSQIIFGVLIAILPVTMIFVAKIGSKIYKKYIGYVSGILFLLGYLLAGASHGNFLLLFTGIGIFSGVGTGFGYWLALTTPVMWFPGKKGLITGIAAAGFGLGAVLMSEFSEIILRQGYNVLELLKIIGISYGIVILAFSNLIYTVQNDPTKIEAPAKLRQFMSAGIFKKLFAGVFLGTFAGLLIIGSLKIIGGQYDISEHILILGVALFAFANFSGRLIWGFLSDYLGAGLSIFLALLFQSLSIISLNVFQLSDSSYLIISSLIGFGFGGNFVLFAKETAQVFGVNNLGLVYPYVLLGYSIAGIAGPLSGGLLYDLSHSYHSAIFLAALVSLAGSLLFLIHVLSSTKNKKTAEKRESVEKSSSKTG